MFDFLRSLTAAEIAKRELEQAKREQLQALSAMEYAASMASYHAGRVERITSYLKEEEARDA